LSEPVQGDQRRVLAVPSLTFQSVGEKRGTAIWRYKAVFADMGKGAVMRVTVDDKRLAQD